MEDIFTNNEGPSLGESHPLKPFLPKEGKLLMLGSFPPQKKRWCMDFFYPNFSNDMWRVMGLAFYEDPQHFVDTMRRCYKLTEITEFLVAKGIGLYDTACVVKRLKDNASDKELEVVEYTDIEALLEQMPTCRTLAATGQKATETLCEHYGIPQPKIGVACGFMLHDKQMTLYRMPSTSRAYPLPLQKKAEAYKRMFEAIGIL